ncbi:MAG: c-type cytochrome [Bdellovibrionales bacterium]|nr:c-type cytochrome [Bdellovibrionales bacterium]
MKLKRFLGIIFLSLFGIIYFTACSGKKVNLQPSSEPAGAQTTDGEISFAAVKPLFNQYCVQCHMSSGMPDLSDYEKAKSVSTKIKNFVSSGFMPQQGSEEAQAISDEERSKIISWVNAGAPLEAVQAAPEGSAGMSAAIELPPLLNTINQCMNCHGNNGVSSSENNPNLAGQDELYLKKQLLHFKDGRRKNQTMNGIAKDLSNAEIDMLASFFGSLQPNDPEQALEETYVKIYESKNMPQGTMSCVGCHANPTFKGQPLKTITDDNGAPIPVPAISGQKSSYIVSQFQNYYNGDRKIAIMQQIAIQHPFVNKETGELNVDEIQPIADFFSELPIINVND